MGRSSSCIGPHELQGLVQLLYPGFRGLTVAAVNPDQHILEGCTTAGLHTRLLLIWLGRSEHFL